MSPTDCLRAWSTHAPAWARAQIGLQPIGTSRVLSAMFGDLPPLDLSPRLGEAWFPALPTAAFTTPDAILVRITAGSGQPLGEAEQRAVRRWVAQLAGIDDDELPPVPLGWHPPEGALRQGRSWELAAAPR